MRDFLFTLLNHLFKIRNFQCALDDARLIRADAKVIKSQNELIKIKNGQVQNYEWIVERDGAYIRALEQALDAANAYLNFLKEER